MDIHEISQVLSAFFMDQTESEHPGYSLRVVSLERGVRLRLEIPVTMDEVRLYVERFTRNAPKLIGVVSMLDVQSISLYAPRGEVYFHTSNGGLTVTRAGMFSVSVL